MRSDMEIIMNKKAPTNKKQSNTKKTKHTHTSMGGHSLGFHGFQASAVCKGDTENGREGEQGTKEQSVGSNMFSTVEHVRRWSTTAQPWSNMANNSQHMAQSWFYCPADSTTKNDDLQ